jgi:hypothetical protein
VSARVVRFSDVDSVGALRRLTWSPHVVTATVTSIADARYVVQTLVRCLALTTTKRTSIMWSNISQEM